MNINKILVPVFEVLLIGAYYIGMIFVGRADPAIGEFLSYEVVKGVFLGLFSVFSAWKIIEVISIVVIEQKKNSLQKGDR